MATALPLAGTAAVVGAGSALLAQGHDGLAITLGLAGGAFLWVALLAPAVARMGAPGQEWPAVLAARTGSPALGTLIQVGLAVATALLVAAEVAIAAAGIDRLAGQPGYGLPIALAVLAGLALVFATLLRPALDGVAAALFAAVSLVVVAAMLALVIRDGIGAVVGVPAVPEIGALEQRLLGQRLADPARLRAHATPFLKTDAINFAALTLTMALGLAALVGGVGRALAGAAARRRAALLVLGLLILLPPLAAHGKRALLAAFDGGIKVAAPPAWLADHVAGGLVEVCGKAPTAGQTLASACGKGFGPQGLLRWSDVAFAREGLPYAALDAALPMSGAPSWAALMLVAVALLAGAVLMARASMGLLALDRPTALTAGTAPRVGVLTVMLMATAGFATIALSAAGMADFVALLALAAALAAITVVPAIAAAALFARPSALAIAMAILAGHALAIGLTVAPRMAPLAALEWSGTAASAPPAVTRRIETLRTASLTAGPAGDNARRQIGRLAEDRVTWAGLAPIASGLWGIALAVVLAILGCAVTRRRE